MVGPTSNSATTTTFQSLSLSLSLTHTHIHTEINTRKYYVYVGCLIYVDLGSHHDLCVRTNQMRYEIVQFIVYTGGSVRFINVRVGKKIAFNY